MKHRIIIFRFPALYILNFVSDKCQYPDILHYHGNQSDFCKTKVITKIVYQYEPILKGYQWVIVLLLSQIVVQSPQFEFPWQHIWKFWTFLNFQLPPSKALRIEPYMKSLGPTVGSQERLEDFSVCELCSLYNRYLSYLKTWFCNHFLWYFIEILLHFTFLH